MSDDLPPGVSAVKSTIPLIKRGPGRPAKDSAPRSQTTVKASAGSDVERAIATMRGLYGAAGAGLLFARLPDTAEVLADKVDDLVKADRDAFEASPQLAKMIAGAAPIASVSAFFVAHFTVGISMIGTARQEIRKRQEKTDDEPSDA